MVLDLSHEPAREWELISDVSHREHSLQTWQMTGSVGDEVLIDAYLPTAPERAVVVAHGADPAGRNALDVTLAAVTLTSSRTAVIAMDAPLHGDRGEGLSERIGLLPHVLIQAVRDHRRLLDLIEREWAGLPIGFAGFSMGGTYGVPLVAIDCRIKAAAIVVAGSTRLTYPALVTSLNRDQLRILDLTDPAIHAPLVGDKPVLLLAAEDDDLVPREATQALAESFTGPCELVFLPGTHWEWPDPDLWFRRLDGFFVRSLPDGNS